MTIERADKEPQLHAIPESLTNMGERDKVHRDLAMLKNVTLSIEDSRVAGPGYGWAFVLRSGEITKEGGGGSRETTGCRMALEAAVAGLRALNQPCAVLLLAHNNYLIQGYPSGQVHG
jgi:hypothetical protein